MKKLEEIVEEMVEKKIEVKIGMMPVGEIEVGLGEKIEEILEKKLKK